MPTSERMPRHTRVSSAGPLGITGKGDRAELRGRPVVLPTRIRQRGGPFHKR